MLKVLLTKLFPYCLFLVFAVALPLTPLRAEDDTVHKGNVGGYTSVGTEGVNQTYNAGYSMYSAAWPLLQEYPGHQFQSGLFGTWMHAHNDKPAPEGVKLYSDIEGGLGWWRDTEYPNRNSEIYYGRGRAELSRMGRRARSQKSKVLWTITIVG
jgi:hypothetical protein